MSVDLFWQSFWEWVKDYQTVVVFSVGAIVWFIKSLVAHRFIPWLRCKLGLHKYEPWDMKNLDRQREEFTKLEIDDVETRRSGVMIFKISRYCNECGMKAPEEIYEEFRYATEPQEKTDYGPGVLPVDHISETSSERFKRSAPP